MTPEKRLRAANQLISLSSLADDLFMVRAQDLNFNNIDWTDFYRDANDDKRILIDFVRCIVDNEVGCDLASISHLNEYDREAVVHGLTIAFTTKDGVENG